MDGNTSTFWDPRGSPASLTLHFSEAVTVKAIGIISWGDTTHDIRTHTLGYRQNGSHPRPPWQHLPSLAPEAIRIEARDAFHEIVPMAFPANDTEVTSLLQSFPPTNASGLLVFPEPRENKVNLLRVT